MFRFITLALVTSILISLSAAAQSDDDDKDKNVDVRSPMGNLHVGKDADAQKAGLPVYPGAHPRRDENNDPVNLGVFTESFGLKLIVAKYETTDPADKVLAFYRDKMKKYGTVLECHSTNENTSSHSDDDKERSKTLKCEGDNAGPVRELKVGTEDNEHIVAIENQDSAKGTTFAVIYLHKQKTGDI